MAPLLEVIKRHINFISIETLLKILSTSFILAFFLLPIFIKLLEKNEILDLPNERKIHTNHAPSMGGVPVFVSIIFSLFIWLYGTDLFQLKYLLIALTIIYIIGIRDDLIPMRPTYKLINQLIPSLLVFFYFDVKIVSLYELFSEFHFSQIISILMTISTIIVITNSYNLIDGIDGLAGSVGVFAITLLGVWFFMEGSLPLSYLCFGFAGGFIAFLYYNWQPSKIFMGDTGALLIGFFISCLVILFLNKNENLANGLSIKFHNPISASLSLLIIPLLDTIRVFIIRLMQKRSPFSPDNNHMHHKLLSLGYSHSKSVIILLFINSVFFVTILGLKDFSEWYSLTVIVFLSLLITYLISSKNPLNERLAKT